VKTYGPDFLTRINETVESLRGTSYKVVQNVYIQPSQDLGVIAAECQSQHRNVDGLRSWLSDATIRYAVRGVVAEADLLSYVYFDHCFANHLIELGRADASESHELLTFPRVVAHSQLEFRQPARPPSSAREARAERQRAEEAPTRGAVLARAAPFDIDPTQVL
jgi:hypothetical protein